MSHTRIRTWWYGASICWLFVWLLPLPLLGAENSHIAIEETQHGANFVLTRQGNRFSLSAQQASLRDVVETLGSMLAIEVVARIPRDTKITLDFAGLSLDDAIQQLRTSANIVSVKNTQQPSGQITRLLVIPIQGGDRVTQPTVRRDTAPPPTSLPQPEPFKFEFDPSKHREGKP